MKNLLKKKQGKSYILRLKKDLLLLVSLLQRLEPRRREHFHRKKGLGLGSEFESLAFLYGD